MRKIFFLFLWTLLLAGCALTFSGCSHYHAGYPAAVMGDKTVYVAPAINRALVAQASGVFTRQLREGILRNGLFHLANKNEADLTLDTTITHYGRSIGTVEEYDTDTAKTLSLNMTVQCSLKDNKTGKYYFKNQSLSTRISINANDSAQSIEYQRLPQLTRDLVQNIVMFIANQHPMEMSPETSSSNSDSDLESEENETPHWESDVEPQGQKLEA